MRHIIFYKTESGSIPVREFLAGLAPRRQPRSCGR